MGFRIPLGVYGIGFVVHTAQSTNGIGFWTWVRSGIFLQCMIKHHFGLNSMDLENYGFLIGGFHVHPVDFELMSSPYTFLLLGNKVQFELELIGLEK